MLGNIYMYRIFLEKCIADTFIAKVGCVMEKDKGNKMKPSKSHNNPAFKKCIFSFL